MHDVTIRPPSDAEVRAAANLMASWEPWTTLRRDLVSCLAALRDPARETSVALADNSVVGFLLVNMQGPFAGYIQSVGVHPEWRSRGLGTRLIAAAEARIFRDSPNAFICVSSFNPRARGLYERLGYQVVGELRDFVVAGHSEWLLRKTIGPLADFKGPTPRSRRLKPSRDEV